MSTIRPLHAAAFGLAGLAALLAWPAAADAAKAAEGRWTPLGPFGGPVSEIAIAPSDPRTLYAATDSGVYRSENAGFGWLPVRGGLPHPRVSPVGALAVDPGDERIVYAGLGRFDPPQRTSIYKTVNGRTWKPLSLTGVEIADLAIDPHDHARILAAGAFGLHRSEDAGATWERLSLQISGSLTPFFRDVVFDPARPGVVYAGSPSYGVFKSVDGGDTWAAKNQGLPDSAFRLALSPSGVLYAAPRHSLGGSYRSTDGAETWQQLGPVPGEAIQALGFAGDEEILIAGTTEGLFRKDETGPGWTALRPGQQEYIPVLAVDPEDRETLYAGVGSDGFSGGFRGVLKSVDAGATWRTSNRGLGGLPVQSVAIAPSDPDVIYVSLAPLLVARSGNGGTTWRLVSPTIDRRVVELAVDPRNADTVYAAGEYGSFWRSTDGGRTWIDDPVEDGSCLLPSSLVVDPRRPNRLFLSGLQAFNCVQTEVDSCHTLQSLDRGQTWTCLEAVREANFYDIVPDPLRAATIYGGGQEGVLKTTDNGQTWIPFNNGLPSSVAALDMTRDGKVLWAAGPSIYKSRNGGVTWRQSARGIAEGAYVGELVVAPSSPSVLYAVADDYGPQDRQRHLYVSTDGGASWRWLTEQGLPALWMYGQAVLSDLVVDLLDPGRLHLGTTMGLYRLEDADR